MLKIEKELKYDFSEGTEESYKNLPENISKKLKLMVCTDPKKLDKLN